MYEYSKTLSHLIFDSIHHILKPPFSPTETVRAANTRSKPTDGSLSINVLSIHYCSTGFMVSFPGWNFSEGSNSFPLATDFYCSTMVHIHFVCGATTSLNDATVLPGLKRNERMYPVEDAERESATRSSYNQEGYTRAWLPNTLDDRNFRFKLSMHMHMTRCCPRDAVGLADEPLSQNPKILSIKLHWRKQAQSRARAAGLQTFRRRSTFCEVAYE